MKSEKVKLNILRYGGFIFDLQFIELRQIYFVRFYYILVQIYFDGVILYWRKDLEFFDEFDFFFIFN